MEHIDNVMMAEESVLSSHTGGASKKTFKYIHNEHDFRKTILFASIPPSIFGVIVNVIVLWLFCCKINKTKLTPYFLNVTIASLLLSFCNLEIAVSYLTKLPVALIVHRFEEMLHICVYDTNIYIFTALTGERCLTFFFPVWWQHHRPNHFSDILCVILWMMSCIMSLVDSFLCSPKFSMPSHEFVTQCKTSTIMSFVTEVIIFFPSMLCFTLAIWIRMQRPQPKGPARIDITIVTIAILILMLNAPVRIADIISFWVASVNWIMLTGITLLLDSFCCCSIPFVYLIVGCWKGHKAIQPFHMFLERALEDTENMAEPTEADEEQV